MGISFLGDHDLGIQEVVPFAQERQDRQRAQRRSGDGQNDPPEGAEIAGAVDAGGVQQGVRQALHILPHHKQREHIGDAGKDLHLIGVEPADFGEDQIQRRDIEFGRDHHGDQQHQEQRVAAPEPIFGKGEAGQRGDEQRQRCVQHRHYDGVEEGAQDDAGIVIEQAGIVFQRERFGEAGYVVVEFLG